MENKEEILSFSDGIYYNDLYFPIESTNRGEYLISPITGFPIKNKKSLNYVEQIREHLKKRKNIKPLNNWGAYVEARRYYGNIPYRTFMKRRFKEFCNYGYSETLLRFSNKR